MYGRHSRAPSRFHPEQLKSNPPMQTQLITLDVSLLTPPDRRREAAIGSNLLRSDALRSHIETLLTQHGDPLRWAITSINPLAQTAHVEAVVTLLK